MAQYAIKELEHLSGIKAHTIRVWEQRYNLLKPQRTETNIRYYNDDDLKTLLNVSSLSSKGYKISRIARMSNEELTREVLALSETQNDSHIQVDALLLAMIGLDEEKFEKALNTPILQYGFEGAMLEVVYPFLERIGILWQTSNIHPAHEHFVSNLIRQKLIVAIDGQKLQQRETSTRYLLFLPEGEFHEIALLFINFLVRARQNHVMYLGQSLPFNDLVEVAEAYKPDIIASAFTSNPERDQVQDYINLISNRFPASRILLYGTQVQADWLTFPENTQRFSRITEVISHLNLNQGSPNKGRFAGS